jgi:hypothetical protein
MTHASHCLARSISLYISQYLCMIGQACDETRLLFCRGRTPEPQPAPCYTTASGGHHDARGLIARQGERSVPPVAAWHEQLGWLRPRGSLNGPGGHLYAKYRKARREDGPPEAARAIAAFNVIGLHRC